MKRLIPLGMLVVLTSCATKIRTPLNRMMSPESVGGAMNSEIEISQRGASESKIQLTSDGSTPPLETEQISAMGYFWGLSLFDGLDFTWDHTASANSMLGIRWQFLGASRRTQPAGHAASFTAAMGGNEHEVDDSPKVEFKLGATDFAIIHGYGFGGGFQVYETIAYSSYTLDTKIRSNVTAQSGDDSYKATQLTGAGGLSYTFGNFRFKLEGAYSQLKWSEGDNKSFVSLGLALGATL